MILSSGSSIGRTAAACLLPEESSKIRHIRALLLVINEPCTFSVQGSLNDVCIFSINIISYSS